MSAFTPEIVEDQVKVNTNLKWIQTLSAGIDGLLAKDVIRSSDIPLTNVKGAFSTALSEFVTAGVLFHTKHIEHFINLKNKKLWKPREVQMAAEKHMVIVGYGDIGAACGKVAKWGLGMKVTGIKRNPNAKDISNDHKNNAH